LNHKNKTIREFIEALSFSKVVILLFCVGMIAFVNSLSNPFVHDDIVSIAQNPRIADWSGVQDIFLRPSSLFYRGKIANIYYRPVLELFQKAQYFIFGLNYHWYHLINIVLHVLNSILAYLMLFYLIKDKQIAIISAVLFLVHPAQAESVSYISGISDLAYTFLLLGSLINYIKSADESFKQKKSAHYFYSLILFCCALYTKEQAIILPLLVVLYELCFSKNLLKEISGKILRVTGVFIVLAGYIAFRIFVLKVSTPSIFAHPGESILRILTIPRIILTYLRIVFLPVDLHFYRTLDILSGKTIPFLALGVLIVAVVFFIRNTVRKDRKIIIFALGWFLIAIFPALNIIPIVLEYSFIWTVDHFLYLPILGILLLCVFIAKYKLRKILKDDEAVLRAFLVIAIVFLSATIKQNTYWKSEVSLFENAAKFEKKSSRVQRSLASAYLLSGKVNRAIAHYKISLNIAQGYLDKAKGSEAAQHYGKFINELRFELGRCYQAKNDFSSAIIEYKRALKLDQENSVLHNSLGSCYLRLNDMDTACVHFKEAVLLGLENVSALNNLAICYIKEGDSTHAMRLLKKAVEIDRDSELTKENLRRLMESNKK